MPTNTCTSNERPQQLLEYLNCSCFCRDVDQVHDMMDDIAEQQDLANEISNAISNPVGFGEDLDEDELASELEQLEQEGLEEELLKVPGADELPSPPQGEVVKPKPASMKSEYNFNF